MPTLGNALDFSQYEGRQFRAHQLGTAPASPVTGQLYYNTANNTLWYWNGSAWISASGGTPPDATTTSKGIVQLAGDLAGTAAAPVVAPLAITDAKVAAANKDGAAATPSMRTLGTGASQALGGTTPLSSIAAPTASVNMNSQKLISVLDPTNPQDGATKNYVDNMAAGLSPKNACAAATTANITLSGLQAIDGYTTLAGDRVLVKNQTTASANGIYVAGSGAWTRSTDMDAWTEVPAAHTWVEMGTINADTGWVCTSDPGGTINTTAINWAKFSAAPAQQVGYYTNSATHGAGTTITITQVTHQLRAARGLQVQVQDNTSGAIEFPDIVVAANGDVTVTYGVALTANTKLVTIVG